MKYALQLILLLIFLASCTLSEPQITTNISAEQAWTVHQDNKKNPQYVVLDVRTPQEFEEKHIDTALNIDYRSESFREQINELDKDATYVIYCAAGTRGGFALETMRGLGFKEVYNIEGGIAAAENYFSIDPE